MTSGTAPRLKAITGVPQAIGSMVTRLNGSGQSMGNGSAVALPKELRLLLLDLAYELGI
ncbi:hypothetical protein [Mesorhizobium sp. M1329]|uniref:hypothetical protein n=1 Tax=Mesorhizobium sp. M1329 TaxID=2957083 RepID=UPI0033350BB9